MKNVLLLETIPDEVLVKLKKSCNVIEAFDYPSALTESGRNKISAIITRGKGQVDQNLISKNKELEVIARCGVGLDNVHVSYASAQNVKVINAPGSNSDTMAEHTFALILTAVRNLYNSIAAVKQDNWSWRNSYQGDEIRGKVLGIIGMGNIGSKVAELSRSFGMVIKYWDQRDLNNGYEYCSLNEVLSSADVISLHVPLIPETENLLGKNQFELMKGTAYVINTARGGIVNANDLVEALDKGEIAGYAADVLDIEPPSSDNKLVKHPKALITPHSGSLTKTTYFKMCDVTIDNVIAALSGNSFPEEFIFNRNNIK